MNKIPSDQANSAQGPSGDATIRFETRGEFHAAFRTALETIAERGCRNIWFCDSDYADWPLGDRATAELLTRWAFPHRRLVVLAAHFDTVLRMHPRWVDWRRQWSHLVQCRQVDPADAAAIPSMVLAPGVLSLKVVDPLRYRGRLSYALSDAVRDRDDLDAFLQRSHEAFPVTQLGL